MSIEATPRRVCAVDTRVVQVSHPCTDHVAIELAVAEFPPSQPGQFLQLRCDADTAGDWPGEGARNFAESRGTYLRRPFSLADHWVDDAGTAHLHVISRAVGLATRWLDRLRHGDTLNVTGPLGVPFHIPDPSTRLLLIGGGVGIPPLLYLSRVLHARGYRDVTVIFGVLRADFLPVGLRGTPSRDGTPTPCLELPGGAAYPAIVTTDDGSMGLAGRVTDAVDHWRAAQTRPAATLALACGPDPMLHAVARQTRAAGIDCQLCIERTMGCGLGTCLSCVVKVREPQRPSGWRWALSCTEGPVFDRDRLLDYAD